MITNNRYFRNDMEKKVITKRKSKAPKISLESSNFYNDILAEREEILKHKWLESEKVGHDIGFEKAFLDWVINHRDNWRKSRSF